MFGLARALEEERKELGMSPEEYYGRQQIDPSVRGEHVYACNHGGPCESKCPEGCHDDKNGPREMSIKHDTIRRMFSVRQYAEQNCDGNADLREVLSANRLPFSEALF